MATSLPPSSFVYCVLNIKEFMYFLYLIFNGRLRLRFLDVKTNPGLRHPVPAVCRILCSNVWGLARNLSDLTVASSQYDVLLCSEILVSDVSRVGGAGSQFWSPCLFVSGQDASGPWDGCICSRWLQSILPTQI